MDCASAVGGSGRRTETFTPGCEALV